MTDPTRNERVDSAADLAAAARDSTMEKLEGAKGQLAEGAERLAAAVDRTADNLAADGDDTVSGFGRSLSGLMRQLAGGSTGTGHRAVRRASLARWRDGILECS